MMFASSRKNKCISSTVIAGYLAVHVIHPAIIGLLFGGMLLPSRVIAAEADQVYKDMVSKYQVDQPDNDVAVEDKLATIESKYTDTTGQASISTKLNSYNTDTSESKQLDVSGYGSNNFSSNYQSTYNEAAGGGIGINKLQQPAVNGSNISVNYSSDGTSVLKRDANGNFSNVSTGVAASTHTINSNQMIGSETSNSNTEFQAGTDYDPDNDDALIDHTKDRINDAATAPTSDAVTYRTLHDVKENNYPPTISRSDPMFANTKSAVNEAVTSTGNWSANCTTGTTYTQKTVHYASWQEHVCQTPKKDNYQSCQLERKLGIPVYITGGAQNGQLEICGSNCVKLTVGKLANNYLNGGSCTTFDHEIKLHFEPGTVIQSAVLTGARWDDHLLISLGGEEIFKHVRRQIVTGQNISWPVNGVNCEESEEWTLGSVSSNHHVSGPIDVTSKIQAAISNSQDGAIIPFHQTVAVGDGGEAFSQITIYFQNMKFQNEIIQHPAGCYDALQQSNGICHTTGWTPVEQGTRMYPESVLAYGTGIPLYPGDTGHLTWIANANGYYCDPLAAQPLCMDDGSGHQTCYNYNQIKNLPDGCSTYANNSMCTLKSNKCVPGWYDSGTGQCYMEEKTYSCDEGTTTTETVKKTTNTCGTLPCIGTDCAAGTSEVNGDFAKTSALLNALSFIGADSSCTGNDMSTCKIFPGELRNCGWAVGIAGSLSGSNCCESPSTGPSMASAAMAAYSVLKHADWEAITAKANTGLNAVTDGVWSNVTNSVTSTAESAYETASSYLVDAYDSIAGNVTTAATEKAAEGTAKTAAQAGLVDQAEQAAMQWASENIPFAQGNLIVEEGGKYALSTGAANVLMALNIIMIAYTVYQIAVMIAQMLTKCEQDEMTTASKISQKSCFKVGGTYCSKDVSYGFGSVCVKESQKYCCYSSMLPRIIMQQAIKQLPNSGQYDCSGMTIAQLQTLDWSSIDLTEWIAAATQEGIIPDGAEDLTLEALTGNGSVISEGDRQTTLERIDASYSSTKLSDASEANAENITADTVDCSYLPRPAICKLQ